MKQSTKIKKGKEKTALVNQIQEDRLAGPGHQELGWLFRPLALCPFPAQALPKERVVRLDRRTNRPLGNPKNEHQVLWTRRSGNIRVDVLGSPEYGIPYGQDILIVLFLAIEARRQNTRKIKVQFYKDFMGMFGFDQNDGRKYRLVRDSLQRIRHSKYSWVDESDPTREREAHYIFIDDIDLYFNPLDPDQRCLWDQSITISERFWDEIQNHRIPTNLKAIRLFKTRPSVLAFYTWLSYRVQRAWSERGQDSIGRAFIPFWGDNGIQNQMSSRITRRPDFRAETKRWLEAIKEVWPECPVEIVGDALQIEISGDHQLDIQEDPFVLYGKEKRVLGSPESLQNENPTSIPYRTEFSSSVRCEGCQGHLWRRLPGRDGLPDYFQCVNHPEGMKGKNVQERDFLLWWRRSKGLL